MQVMIPSTEEELRQRAQSLAGLTLQEIADRYQCNMPKDLKKDKGFVGQLIELALGASAGSKPLQDFPHLNIELKTLPIGMKLQPLETTYITTAPLLQQGSAVFEETVLYHKLQRILWVPIQAERDIPLGQRVVGQAFLWEPSAQQWCQIKRDWEEVTTLICTGQIEEISAKQGEVLQVRPKAANGRALTDALGSDGSIIQTRPRGFYLKKHFTQTLLDQVFY